MTIELTGVIARNERRLRLVFSSPPNSAAYGSPAPTAYVVDNLDGKGVSPGVAAAIIVSGSVTNVELALDADIVEGALYEVSAIGIVGVDTTASTSASTTKLRYITSATPPNVEPKVFDADLLLYGRDLVHSGTDYLETPEGDLATVGGAVNASAAMRRRLLGSPLAWAPDYSPQARAFVDGPVAGIGGLRGKLQQQALADDRVKSVDVRFELNDDAPDESTFVVTPTFVGGPASGNESVDVPIG